MKILMMTILSLFCFLSTPAQACDVSSTVSKMIGGVSGGGKLSGDDFDFFVEYFFKNRIEKADLSERKYMKRELQKLSKKEQELLIWELRYLECCDK